MEIWYLLGLFELSIIFHDFVNMVFRAVLDDKNSLNLSAWSGEENSANMLLT